MIKHTFPLAQVLQITTGQVLSLENPMREILSVLEFMVGRQLYLDEVLDATELCRGRIFEQHPEISDVMPIFPEFETPEHATEVVLAWVAEQVALYGPEIDVEAFEDDPLPLTVDEAFNQIVGGLRGLGEEPHGEASTD